VREPTRAPMLRCDNISWLRLKLAADLATPRPVLEGFRTPRGLLHRRNGLPVLVVARTISTMQSIEDTEAGLPSRQQHLQHVSNAMIGFRDLADPRPDFATLGNEVVVRVDHQHCRGAQVVVVVSHDATTSLLRAMARR